MYEYFTESLRFLFLNKYCYNILHGKHKLLWNGCFKMIDYKFNLDGIDICILLTTDLLIAVESVYIKTFR